MKTQTYKNNAVQPRQKNPGQYERLSHDSRACVKKGQLSIHEQVFNCRDSFKPSPSTNNVQKQQKSSPQITSVIYSGLSCLINVQCQLLRTPALKS